MLILSTRPELSRLRQLRRRNLSALGLGFLIACSPQVPDPVQDPQPLFQPTTSVEDLMRALIDPAADTLWDAVVITSTIDGITRRQPETDEDWLSLERATIALIEAGNLLQMEGRQIAEAGSVSELPGIDLDPAEIAQRVTNNRDAWFRTARELHDAGTILLTAVRNKDIDALLAGGTRLDVACESCHSRFWYPDYPAPNQTDQDEDGSR